MPTPTTVQARFQVRADTAANWTSANPTLLLNEIGIETDTKKLKMGDGTTAWASLAYFPSIVSGGTVLGNLEIGTTGTLTFEGSTADGFETTLAVVNPTADRTITLPNVTGTVVTTGDTGTVTSTMIADGTIVNDDISASAAIVDTKLATISTASKVNGTALTGTIPSAVLGNSTAYVGTTAVVLNRASANQGLTGISSVALPGSTSGTITIQPTAVAGTTTITLPATTGTVVTTGDSGTITSGMIADGAIVNADINASAAIAGTKISPDFGSQNIVTTGSTTAASLIPTTSTAPNYGIYSPSTSTIGVAVNGALQLGIYGTSAVFQTNAGGTALYVDTANNRTGIGTPNPDALLTVSGIASFGAGAVGTPSITTVGDLDTGMWFPAANTTAISTGGSERLRIDSSGRLLAGTSSADLTHNASVGKVFIEGSGDASSSLVQTCWNTSNTSQAWHILAKSGGASIGTRGIVEADEFLGVLSFEGDDGTNFIRAAAITARVDGTPGTNDMPGRLMFFTTADGAASPTERVRIDSSGRVGIGATSVTNLLHLRSDSSSNVDHLYLQNRNGGANSGARIAFSSGAVDYTDNRYAYIGAINTGALENGNHLVFATNANGLAATEKVRIDSSGRLLVGTSTSVSQFGVQPQIQSTGTSGAGGYLGLTVFNTIADSAPNLILGHSKGGSVGTYTASIADDLMGEVSFTAANGTDMRRGASIAGYADGGWGTSDHPGRLVLATTADGASTSTERLRIANDGRHTINSNAHQGTALTTTAPANLYTSTGTYTDTATAASGTAAHGTIVAFDNPAIAATNASVTYTNASTVYIDGAPTAGTNVTITNAFSLFVAAGNSRFGGNVLSSSATGGIGYATGAGGAVTQATSRTTGVTLNTICGAITLVSAAGTTTWQSFTVTNSAVAATDNVIVNQKSGTDLYMIHVTNIAAGSFRISFATTGGTTTEQPVFNFSVIKAVAA